MLVPADWQRERERERQKRETCVCEREREGERGKIRAISSIYPTPTPDIIIIIIIFLFIFSIVSFSLIFLSLRLGWTLLGLILSLPCMGRQTSTFSSAFTLFSTFLPSGIKLPDRTGTPAWTSLLRACQSAFVSGG